MKKRVAFFTLAMATVIVVGGYFFLRDSLGITGYGDEAMSPNGLYQLNAMVYTNDAFWQSGEPYCVLKVIDVKNATTVREIRLPLGGGGGPVSARGEKSSIQWTPDSSSVSVPIDTGVSITIQVP